MKIKIDDYCIRCGTCVDIHPGIFSFNREKDCIDIKEIEFNDDVIKEVKDAIKNCHVCSIKLSKE